MNRSILLLFLLPVFGCSQILGEHGNGNIITESREIDSFDRLSVAGKFDVSLVHDYSKKVHIRADENLMQYIEVYNRGNTLHIDEERNLMSSNNIEISVPFQSLERIASAGASNIKNEDTIESEEMDIDLSGAGKLNLMLRSNVLSIDLSGAGMVYLSGRSNSLDASMSGARSLDALSLPVNVCSMAISGVGNARLHVNESLHASVSGLGGIQYMGDAEKVISDVSGIGKVTRIEDETEH